MLVSQISIQSGSAGTKSLGKNDMISVKSGRSGQVISCVNGSLWITQEGAAGDRILNAGEKLCTDLPGLVIVQALKDSQVILCKEKKDKAALQFPWQSSRNVCQCMTRP
jgi:hypothetical protein